MGEVLNIKMDVSGKLDLINKRIEEVLKTDSPDLTEMALYTLRSGGKRLRPLIVLLVYELITDEEISKVLDLAVAYEIMHSASLIHDDIIDEAEERRGSPPLHIKFNIPDAIVTGDFLFSVAYKLGATYGTEVSDIVARAARKLAEGQIMESRNLGNLEITENDYFHIISNKTAYFFGAGARSAACVATQNEEMRENMFKFAYNVGMAFQITDDVLDIIGKEENIGKMPFTDFKHSTLTLPMIYALKHGKNDDVGNLRHVIRGERTDTESIELAKQFLVDCGAVDYSIGIAKNYIDEAIKAMRSAERTPDLETLLQIAYSVISRIRI
ncbi:MAG: polyprenyl synthetase family protein [Candidatus Thermoplasmatota archaeon]|jgi:octaprenyl-diphosphate synthase|nr:polyprenyl synthetase family protein [Candidatus Thermoplasmatota archaeon]MCL5790898.1 polyprenyl synthetase family protein [Candidatus Thermoplasmatota archaeon]